MIIFDDVTVAYPGHPPVLQHVSVKVPDGGVLLPVGPNGSGKTTLVRLVLGLVRPVSGHVDGLAGRRLAAVFQEDRLLPHLTAIGNIRVALRRRIDNAEILAELAALGIDAAHATVPVADLSGGQRRRVCLARALLADADVVCLDEPFTGIDADSIETVIAHTAERCRAKDVVLVTHNPDQAAPFGGITLPLGAGDRACLLDKIR